MVVSISEPVRLVRVLPGNPPKVARLCRLVPPRVPSDAPPDDRATLSVSLKVGMDPFDCKSGILWLFLEQDPNVGATLSWWTNQSGVMVERR